MPIGHHRPFGLLVPVKFANAAGRKPHVHAGDRCRDREHLRVDLARPAAGLNPLGRDVERRPELRNVADIGRRRIEERRLVIRERRVLRAGIRERLGAGVDRALRRQIRIAEHARGMAAAADVATTPPAAPAARIFLRENFDIVFLLVPATI